MGCMSPSRAWAARARMAARAGSGGASSGPKSARLATRPGSAAARCAATIVPMECATTCARSTPARSMHQARLVDEQRQGERPLDPVRASRAGQVEADASGGARTPPAAGVNVLAVPPRPWIISTGSPSPSISTAMRSTSTATSRLPRCGTGD